MCCLPGVSPLYAAGRRSVAQPGSAPDLGSGGRVFESRHSDHFKNNGLSVKSVRSMPRQDAGWVTTWVTKRPHFPCARGAFLRNVALASLLFQVAGASELIAETLLYSAQ
ncbi:hypothetical protein MPL3356_390178 [Mesorhizobium plurifarium]|uniref:Uncharacterized protein n=1 Tax=Mesorhizobium plurifarium TaxID=69974 RepID=A0A090E5D6_MESPL|nr:hypothetical protein MPL3356_390178 [Mesorhizobium plurifarium]